MEIELHHALIYDDIYTDENQKELCYRVWDFTDPVDFNSVAYELNVNFHCLYLIVHLRKHLLYSGVGFRQFLDLSVISQAALNWKLIIEWLERLNLLVFAEKCFSLCKRWFGTDTILLNEISDEFFENVTQQIFMNGVFGFDNDNNFINGTFNKLNNGQSKATVLVNTFFPKYSYMIMQKPYTFVYGKKYLLPIAWLYRFYYNLVNGHLKKDF